MVSVVITITTMMAIVTIFIIFLFIMTCRLPSCMPHGCRDYISVMFNLFLPSIRPFRLML